MENIISYRIRNARKLRSKSMQEVADFLGISRQMVNKYEKGISIPASDKLIKLSNLFELKLDYFFTPARVDFDEIRFRKRAALSNRKLDSIKELIKFRLDNYFFIEDILSIDFGFENPIKNIQINEKEDIIYAVERLKEIWEIGFDPVHNIIQLLEDKKIKVLELNNIDAKFDGLSAFIDNKYPVIVINKDFDLELKRFSILHELGHLLLNLNYEIRDKEEEICNKFASEFLLEDRILINEMGNKRKHFSLKELILLQEKYGISIKAIVYKMNEIGIINDNQHSNFYRKIRSDKNIELEIDKSRFGSEEYSNRFESLVYRALSQGNISLSKASALLNIPIENIKVGFVFV